MKCDCGKQVAKCDRYNGVLFCDYCKHDRRPVCPLCARSILDRYFVIVDGDNAYHVDCYKQNTSQCSICRQVIDGG
ncbi:hypothetical protein HOL46_00850, partial [Candidatus Falkowbacteria bacterium]|nr:hypothetical protein [Candidatus Falkowbacteria bacterium]